MLSGQAIVTLATFTTNEGYSPAGPLVLDRDGNLYGTTQSGGTSGNGTLFELPKGSSLMTTLASFPQFDIDPTSLAIDANGNLYGTTAEGGAGGDGLVFELAKGSTQITTLASFSGPNGFDPNSLTVDSAGNVYGTTFSGGAAFAGATNYGYGTIFEIPQGGTLTVLASFAGAQGGQFPRGGLIIDATGNLYGTTTQGGASSAPPANVGYGTVFELPHGSSGINVLASFDGIDGANPVSTLLMDNSGDLYGASGAGGASFTGSSNLGFGTVFELPAGSTTIKALASFNNANGDGPYSTLMDSSGDIYGTTTRGGPSDNGTVFELPSGSSTIVDVGTFDAATTGDFPLTLVADSAGNLFGDTLQGGASGVGTVFEIPGPDYILQKATEPDPYDISLTYDVNAPNLAQIPLDVYRSAVAEPSSLTDNVATALISNPADLTPGPHTVTVSLNGAVLSINPSEEFVDVVGSPDAKGQATDPHHYVYFQKLVLGVATHGLELDGVPPTWLAQMTTSLQQNGYNQVIGFNWAQASRLPVAGITTYEASQLANQVATDVDSLVSQTGVAPGSVVDLQFIGHSRGAVVVNQAMRDLASTSDPALVGSFKKLTLLDPHPANSADHFLSAAPNAAGKRDQLLYNAFVALTRDPPIVIPSNVDQAEVYYQQERFSVFPASSDESSFNLWGDVRDVTLQNSATTAVNYYPLKDARLQGGTLVGHAEVPLWYLQNVAPALNDPNAYSSQAVGVSPSPARAVITSPPLHLTANPLATPSANSADALPTGSTQAPFSQGRNRTTLAFVGTYLSSSNPAENAMTDALEAGLVDVTLQWAGFTAALESLSL